MPTALRLVFITMVLLILLGIGLTGFDVVHWLLYIPVIGLTFAAVTGICPSLMLFKALGFNDGGAAGSSRR